MAYLKELSGGQEIRELPLDCNREISHWRIRRVQCLPSLEFYQFPNFRDANMAQPR
jgi:hypothetical protein